jgi:hypothetical protein
MKTTIVRLTVLCGVMMAAILLVALTGRPEAFTSVSVTAIAALSLILALPLLDSAIAGGSVRPETAGGVTGLCVGFFVRQSEVSDALARGADRILLVALVISVALVARRLWIGRRLQRA